MSMRLGMRRMFLLLCILACAPVRPKYLLQEYLLTLGPSTATVAPFHEVRDHTEMSGTIPANIGARFPKLNELVLDGTSVSGTLPHQLLMHPELRLLSLSRTRQLSGMFVVHPIDALPKLERFKVEQTRISGTFPAFVANLQSLTSFTFSGDTSRSARTLHNASFPALSGTLPNDFR